MRPTKKHRQFFLGSLLAVILVSSFVGLLGKQSFPADDPPDSTGTATETATPTGTASAINTSTSTVTVEPTWTASALATTPPSTAETATMTPAATGSATPTPTATVTATPVPPAYIPVILNEIPTPTRTATATTPASTPVPPTVTQPAATATMPPGAYMCAGGAACIKGNISAEGERIYHFPGCGSYERTVIDPSQGERWFVTSLEAEAAGWRRASNCP